MSRTRDLLLAGVFSVLALGGLPGCDLSTSSTTGTGANLHVVGGGEGTLPVADGEPILSDDGVFELYYAAETFTDSACVSAWVRNTGPTLSTWKISVGLDRAITDSTYSGAGDNLLFLYERELVVVPKDATKLRSGDVVSIRYCASPISVPVDLVVTSGASDGSLTPGDGGPATQVLTSGNFTVYQSVANDWQTGGCVQVALRNGGPAVSGWALRLELDQPLDGMSSQWGAVIHPVGGAFVDVFAENSSQPLAKGGSVSFGYCGEPLAFVKSITSITFDLVPTDLTEPQQNTFAAGQIDDPGKGVSLRYTSPTAAGDGVGCYDVTFQNTGNADLAVTRFVVATFADFELSNTSWHGEVDKTATAELTFSWPASWGVMTKGKEYKGNVCLKPVQKPYVLYVY